MSWRASKRIIIYPSWAVQILRNEIAEPEREFKTKWKLITIKRERKLLLFFVILVLEISWNLDATKNCLKKIDSFRHVLFSYIFEISKLDASKVLPEKTTKTVKISRKIYTFPMIWKYINKIILISTLRLEILALHFIFKLEIFKSRETFLTLLMQLKFHC